MEREKRGSLQVSKRTAPVGEEGSHSIFYQEKNNTQQNLIKSVSVYSKELIICSNYSPINWMPLL